MKIQNLMKCTMFYPYASVNPARGKDIKSDEFSGELESTRFFNPLLQLDWKNGKIAVFINEADKAMLGASVVDAVRYADNRATPIPVPKVEEIKMAVAIEEIPLVSTAIVKEEVPVEVAPVVEPVKVVVKPPTQDVSKELGAVSISELNKPKKSKAPNAAEITAAASLKVTPGVLPSLGIGVPKLDGTKATVEEIGSFMKGPV